MTTKRPKLDPVTLRWAAGILAERAKEFWIRVPFPIYELRNLLVFGGDLTRPDLV